MKKIITFKKELPFKTKLCEISSISLEHIINSQTEDLISGEFLINGEYKMTEGSINKEKYDFKLPFDIAINPDYEKESIKLDIDNFYYEILNNEILKVNIDLLIEASEKEIIPKEVKPLPKEDLIKDSPEDRITENIANQEKINNSIIDNKTEDNSNTITNITKEESNTANINIFDNINNNETYSAYYVYIVKEEDTIDKILDKYKITKEELSNYNDIENIKPFDKIIIPQNGQ